MHCRWLVWNTSYLLCFFLFFWTCRFRFKHLSNVVILCDQAKYGAHHFEDLLFLLCCSFLKIVLIFFLFFPFPSSSSWSCCCSSAFSLLWSFSSVSLGRLASLVKDSGLPRLDTGSSRLDPPALFTLIVSGNWETYRYSFKCSRCYSIQISPLFPRHISNNNNLFTKTQTD